MADNAFCFPMEGHVGSSNQVDRRVMILRGQNMALMLLFGEPLWADKFPNLGLLDCPFLILHQMRKCIEGFS